MTHPGLPAVLDIVSENQDLCSDDHAESRDAPATHIVRLLIYQRNRSLLVRWQ